MDIERRTVLQAGGILAVGGLVAACSSGSETTHYLDQALESSGGLELGSEALPEQNSFLFNGHLQFFILIFWP